MQGYKRPCRGVVGEEVGDGVPDGDDVVMKGSDDEVRGGAVIQRISARTG